MNARKALGRYGEDLAARRLREAGMTVLERNWRCAEGEIDIVARDGDALVVCEVKTRARGAGTFEHPMAAVTPAKAARLRRLAARWLTERWSPDTGPAARRRPHRPGRRACCRTGARPWSSTRGGWPDGVRPYVLGGAGRGRGRRRRGSGRSGAGGRSLHPGGAARQEPDREPGPGSCRGRQLGCGLAAEEAHRRPQPRLRAQERQRLRPRGGLRGARCRRAHRPAGDRRADDDRRAGPGRPGAPGAGGPPGRPGRCRGRIPAGRGAGAAAAEASLVPGRRRCWACAACGSSSRC